jgi:hypothetical protein
LSRSRLRLPAAALALALAAGCAHRPAVAPGPFAPDEPHTQLVEVGEARFKLVFWPEDAAAAAQVVRGLEVAVPRVARWGGLAAPVTLTIHPSHEAVDLAVGQKGFDWLRAWARYDTIELQSPATWGPFGLRVLGASDKAVAELLTHELTHCAMYQRGAGEWSWSYKGIPTWFSEGMASVTAEQGYKRAGHEALWRFYDARLPLRGAGEGATGARARATLGRSSEEGDPLSNPGPLFRDGYDAVYGAAHRSFEFLLARYGEARVRKLLERMRGGLIFSDAFQEAMGLSERAFVDDFRRYVIWQGWREPGR